MSRPIRPFLLLAICQALCLLLGLWVHGRFVVSSARWDARRDLPERGIQIAPAVPSAAPGPAAAGRETGVPAERLIAALPPAGALAFLWTWGLQMIVAWLVLSRLTGEHTRTRMQSEEQTARATQELVRTRDAVIFGLAKLAESRDQDTGHHLERIALYSTRLATALRRHPKFTDVISPGFVRLIGISSALHDIGKVSVEDSILQKPGRLTEDERFRMQLHAGVGGECIRQIERRLGNSNFLEMAREIALYHHERWDGAGYPTGLAAEAIPLAARIVSVADVYDALSSERVYKSAYPHEKCVDMIRREAGRQFDPDLVEVFLRIEAQFREISARFQDEPRDQTPAPRESTPATPRFRMSPEQEQALILVLDECERDAVEPEPALAS